MILKSDKAQESKKTVSDLAKEKIAKSVAVAVAHESSEEYDYGDYGSDDDGSNDSYWFTSSDEDDE